MCSVRDRDRASIIHADLDSFYASVEQRDDPSLRGRPISVGGGLVLACSYEAKAHGVYTPMAFWKAKQLCPDLVSVPAHFEAYSDASRAVFEIFHDTTPLVEGVSVDEAFLDVSGLARIAGTPTEIAVRLRTRVRDEVGLPISVGIARTKHLAKVASAASKPDGLLVVEPEDEDRFLLPLPVSKLWGVGPKTTEKLNRRGIFTVGDAARLGEESLVAMLGLAAGNKVHALSSHLDPRRIEVGKRRGSIGSQSAIGWRPKTADDIDRTLIGIVDRVTRRMRKAERLGRTATIRLRFEDFERITRSHTLAAPTSHTETVLDVCRSLLRDAMPLIEEKGCTLIGVSMGNLCNDPPSQQVLPFSRHETEALDDALDDLRERFGTKAVTRAVLLGHDSGMSGSVPLLPD
jgi:DNA polymerase-4